MKKKNMIFIIMAVIIVIVISILVMYMIDRKRMENNKPVLFSTWGYDYVTPVESGEENIVIIKNGHINNESLIENFIEKANQKNNREMYLTIREYNSEDNYIENKLSFIPSKSAQKADENESANTVINLIEQQNEYGKFIFTKQTNGNEIELNKELNTFNYELKRKTKDDVVSLYFNLRASLKEDDDLVVCSYSLESSDYTKKFNLNYSQENDNKIDTIIDKAEKAEYEFNVYTFDGSVSFTKGTDMVYTFDTALEQGVITIEDILEQAKIDTKYGVCKMGYYYDGGSTEYYYADYTILKFNSLDECKDLVIGPSGEIINKVDDLVKDK